MDGQFMQASITQQWFDPLQMLGPVSSSIGSGSYRDL